eukprot:12772447-Alexandrium_andersonii.AAC.1
MKFETTTVAKPVALLGKLVGQGFELYFGGDGATLCKDGVSLPLERFGDTFSLKVKRSAMAP